MRTITYSSNKDELITAAVELTDDQAQRIKELEAQQAVLFAAVGLLTLLVLA